MDPDVGEWTHSSREQRDGRLVGRDGVRKEYRQGGERERRVDGRQEGGQRDKEGEGNREREKVRRSRIIRG